MFVLLPTLKLVIKEIENNEDDELENQGQKLKFYLSEKEYLKNCCVNIVKAIVTCYEKRYSSLLSDNNNESSGVSDDENMEISDGDLVLFDFFLCIEHKRVSDDENMEISDGDLVLFDFFLCIEHKSLA